MNVEIITIYSLNYGNRLQNYALQEVLKELGANVTTNRVEKSIINRKFKETIKRLRNRTTADLFSIFDNKNIHFRYTHSDAIYDEKIDFYIAGSDQIWNPYFAFNSDREFLVFAPSSKRIAYSASIGISEVPIEFQNRFKNNLKDFKCISVRENAAERIINDIIGINAKVVLDPTMLLTKKQWDIICKQSHIQLNRPFVVKYFLGHRSNIIDNKINEFAARHGYEIVDITSKACQYTVGPAEFLYLLNNSMFNFVDSFHGTVFSIVFNKPFYTFSRPEESGFGNMNSRFDTIFSKFALSDRYIEDFNIFIPNFNIDYNYVNVILDEERSKSIDFLKEAMEVSE